MGRTGPEVADIFRKYSESFIRKKSLSYEQLRTLRAVAICRTAELGGHIDRCSHCGHEIISYNSCRNRHCPKCQALAKASWLDARKAELLNVNYFHLVFTLPKVLNQIALQNKKEVYNILFKAASKTLLTIAGDSKHLGVQTGFMAVLHTWGQTLLHHPHLHCVIPGGGLSQDERKWIRCRRKFFLPIRVLSRLFRRLFLEYLIRSFHQNRLAFYGDLHRLSDPTDFSKLIEKCSRHEWVVYAKSSFSGAEKVLDYLSRYTYRTGISNNRIVKVNKGEVSFSWRNYRKENRSQIMTLESHEFIRRFLMHVLPSGFVRIRYFGFLCNRYRREKLKHCRRLLLQPDPIECKDMDWKTRHLVLTGKDIDCCPRCGQGRLVIYQNILPMPGILSRPPPYMNLVGGQ
jgi:hypothetical protein